MIYDPDADRPLYAAVTTARTNDVTAARDMPIEPGATYVFDLGYYDYDFWARLDAAGCRLVTRFKRSTPLTHIDERLVAPGGPILSDRVSQLPARLARNRKAPFQAPARAVCVRIETGKTLRLMTNDLDAPPRRSPRSTKGAGRSSCSSAGSSRR